MGKLPEGARRIDRGTRYGNPYPRLQDGSFDEESYNRIFHYGKYAVKK